MLLDFWTVAVAALGVLFFVAGTAGVLRFPDPLSRLHAVTKADTLGVGLIALAIVPQAATPLDAAKILLIWLATMLSAATVGPLLARVAIRNGDER